MRPWTIPILGTVALSLAAPATADARPRFGPGAILGAFAGAVFGGLRPAIGHHRRNARGSADEQRGEDAARIERQPVAGAPSDRTGPAFSPQMYWPNASADLAEYIFFPRGKDDRFWAYGYGTILNGAFAAADADNPQVPPGRAKAGKEGDAAPQAKEPDLSSDPCGGGQAALGADALIERIEQAIRPSESQREVVLAQLRAALLQAAERIKATCPTAAPATPAERLKAIQDRIWAMRDGLLTIRLPFEQFYDSLTGEQHWHLHRDEGTSRETGAKIADARVQPCAEQATGLAAWPMRAIERALRPTEQQRASLEALRLRSAGMTQLIISSCPTYPLLGHMGRFAAATDRLDVMLFAVMTMSPPLQDFYDSLDDKQKAGLNRVIRQFRRSDQS
jgi:hypothetical protein